MHGWCVCVCEQYARCVCTYTLLFVVFDMQLHWKVQLKCINRNDLSVVHSPDIPLISNEMKRMKNQQTHTHTHIKRTHISFVLSWRFPWCLYFFHSYLNIEHNNFSIARWDTHSTQRVYFYMWRRQWKNSVDSMYTTTIFLFVVCFSQSATITFFGRCSQDRIYGFFWIFL